MRPILLFTTFAIACYPAPAVSQSDAARPNQAQYLKGQQHFVLRVAGSSTSECRITDNDVRVSTINRIVPAGIIIDNSSVFEIQVNFHGVYMSAVDACVVNASVRVREWGFFRTIAGVEHASYLDITEFASISYGNRPAFSDYFLNNALVGLVDRVLAVWREGNAGAAFVRQEQAPQIAQEPNLRTVQERLRALGIYAGTIDGRSGPQTRTAIQAFQRAQLLPATGDLDQETMRRLFP
jgi:hypothetical protein